MSEGLENVGSVNVSFSLFLFVAFGCRARGTNAYCQGNAALIVSDAFMRKSNIELCVYLRV